MKSSITTLLYLGALLSPVALAQEKDKESKECFTQQGKVKVEYDDKRYAVSPVIDCESGQEACMVEEENTEITAERFLNITSDKTDKIFDVISDATSVTFTQSLTDDIGDGGGCEFWSGNKSYMAYIVAYNCVHGTLGDCVDGVEAGTPVRACHPKIRTTEDTLLGKFECVAINKNGSNSPDIPFQNSAPGLASGLSFLPALSLLVVVGSLGTWVTL